MQTSPKEQIELLENFKRMLSKHEHETIEAIKLAMSLYAFEVAGQLTQLSAQCKKENQLCCDIIDTIHATRLTGSVVSKPISKDFLYKRINETIHHFGKKEAVRELIAILTEEYTVYAHGARTPLEHGKEVHERAIGNKPVILNRELFTNDLIDELGSGPGMMGGGDFAEVVGRALSKQGVKWQ